MTAPRTYNELFEPPIRLSLAQAPGGYVVWDQACRYYVLSPSPLEFCLRFMQAMAAKGEAVIDEASVERATWHSVRVPDNVVPIRKANA